MRKTGKKKLRPRGGVSPDAVLKEVPWPGAQVTRGLGFRVQGLGFRGLGV